MAEAALEAGAHAPRRRTHWKDTLHILATVAPGIIWIVLFLVVPSAFLISVAFMTNGVYGTPELPLTFDAFRQLAGFGILGWSSGNLEMLLRSVWQTVIATGLVTAIAYPLAFYITTRSPTVRPVMLLLVLVPSWTNQVIRSYGWMALLAPSSLASDFAAWIGFIPPQMGLFPSNFAVGLGLTYNFLPFMTLPLYAAFEKLDYSQVEAARDLYGNPFRTFWNAVFPQTLPGLMAGVVLVAIPAFGMFVIPKLLGGGKSFMIGNFVANQFTVASNWPLGAAASILMLIATIVGLAVFRRMGRKLGGEEASVI